LFLYKRKQTIETAYANGQAVMGRANHKLGKLLPGSPEDRRFRAFFGVSAQVSVTAWMMMEEENFLPPNPNFLHVCLGERPQDDKQVCVAVHPVTFFCCTKQW
jgi:hypothetical protein